MSERGWPPGYYMIDPDPTDSIPPFQVWCDVYSQPARELVGHNMEQFTRMHGCTTPGCINTGQ